MPPLNVINEGLIYARNGVYSRAEVRQSRIFKSDILHVKIGAHHHSTEIKQQVIKSLENLLGLRVNLSRFYQFAKNEPKLRILSTRFLGLKPPKFPSVFEGIMNGIACQQLSLHVGLTLLNRLSERAGLPFETPTGTRFSFPSYKDLRAIPIRSFRSIGFSKNKATAIKNLSDAIYRNAFEPEILETLDDGEAIARLIKLRGIGRWTAEYVLLRGLGRTNLFPGDDVGARNNLRHWLKIKNALDYAGVNDTLQKWRPFAGLVYFHLLLDSLENSGYIASDLPNKRAA